jgi:hypothetical protein
MPKEDPTTVWKNCGAKRKDGAVCTFNILKEPCPFHKRSKNYTACGAETKGGATCSVDVSQDPCKYHKRSAGYKACGAPVRDGDRKCTVDVSKKDCPHHYELCGATTQDGGTCKNAKEDCPFRTSSGEHCRA